MKFFLIVIFSKKAFQNLPIPTKESYLNFQILFPLRPVPTVRTCDNSISIDYVYCTIENLEISRIEEGPPAWLKVHHMNNKKSGHSRFRAIYYCTIELKKASAV